MTAHPTSVGTPLVTNGFEVILPDTVEVLVRDFPDGAAVKAERERVSGHWFVHWFQGTLYYLRLKGGGPNVSGGPLTLDTLDHPWLLRSCLEGELYLIIDSAPGLRQD